MMALSLNACVVMTPSPALKVLELATLTVSNASALVSNEAESPLRMGHERFDGVCIELKRSVALADFVPALQAELDKHGVSSRVYDGALPVFCRHSVHYIAQLEWGRRFFESEFQPYLSAARLELRQQGKVLAASSYRLGALGLDKWGSTRDKLAPSVRVLVSGLPRAPLAEATSLAVPAQSVFSNP